VIQAAKEVSLRVSDQEGSLLLALLLNLSRML